MIGGIGDFNGMTCFFLGMVGVVGFSSSFISSLMESSILVLISWFLVPIAREVSYRSAILTSSFSFASFFVLGGYLVVLGGVIGRALVVALVIGSGILRFRLSFSIQYCITVLVSGSIKSC